MSFIQDVMPVLNTLGCAQLGIPEGQEEATFKVIAAPQAPVGLRFNLVLTATMKAGKATVTRFAPAMPIQVVFGQ